MDKRFLMFAALLMLVLTAVSIFYLFFKPTEVKYVCTDGSVVLDLSKCPIRTTTIPETTTELITTTEPTEATSIVTTLPEVTTTISMCMLDSDCGVNVNSSAYCSDKYIKIDVMKHVCRNPGTSQASCVLTKTAVSHVIDVCAEGSEVCRQGECVLVTCLNGKRDYGEDKIDCGPNCPKKCDEFSVLCSNDEDCGSVNCSESYYCLETNPAYNCIYGKCVNAGAVNSGCFASSKSVVTDYCGKNEHCTEGRKLCAEGGTCKDCIRNQDESQVDCGGASCRPCAAKPESYSTVELSSINNFRVNYTDIYGNSYVFVLDHVLMDVCPYGASLNIEKNNVLVESGKEIDIYSNNTLHKFRVGLIFVTTSSVKMWVQEP